MNGLVDKLRASVAADPDAEALVHHDRRLTYGALWRQVRGIAGFLRDQGAAPGQRVALLLDDSIAYVSAYYGVLAAGAVAVPLSTDAKAADLVNWLAHSEAAWLFLDLNHPEATAVRSWCDGRVRVVAQAAQDEAAPWPSSGAIDQRETTATPAAANALATILYTSGTTGRPKGVMLSHRNLVANVDSILAFLPLRRRDRVVNVLPLYYSYGSSVLHTHVAVGGCVISGETMVYPHRVVERMVAERATGLSGVAATFALLLERVPLADYDLGALRYATQAGGPITPALVERIGAALPHARLYLMYGQTEATARLSYLPPDRLADKRGSIGTAIPGVTLAVCDDQGAPAAVDEIGEIWARGPNIMLGYWRDPAATAEALVDGWLKTGDLAYRDRDGFLHIRGRKADIIKSGSHRVHPGDVEEAIAELEGVADVAVVGVPDAVLGQVLKAYVVPRTAGLDVAHVRAHCRRRLPAYKTPRFVELVARLPRTSSGKLQRFLLTSNDHDGALEAQPGAGARRTSL